MPSHDPIQDLIADLRNFAAERDWDQFHSPKNLASALSVEAAELLEHFQWMTEAQSTDLDPAQKQEVAEEIADILLYALRIGDKLDIDVLQSARDKMIKNREKYPADQVRGSSKKYTKYS